MRPWVLVAIGALLVWAAQGVGQRSRTRAQDEQDCWAHRSELGLDASLKGIDFDASGRGWAVGNDGLALRYGQDGEWRRADVDPELDMVAVATLDEASALAVSDLGDVYRIGSAAPVRQTLGDGFVAGDLCVGAGRALVVGRGGRVFQADPAHEDSWTALDSGTTHGIEAVDCRGDEAVFVTEPGGLFRVRGPDVSPRMLLPWQVIGQRQNVPIQALALGANAVHVVGGACTHDLECRGFFASLDLGSGDWAPPVTDLTHGVSGVVSYSDTVFGITTFGMGGRLMTVDLDEGSAGRIGSTFWLSDVDRDMTRNETWAVGGSDMLVCDDSRRETGAAPKPSPSVEVHGPSVYLPRLVMSGR